MIRSLRSRLLVSVLAIATLGLVVMAFVTYAEQRSFLYQRVDQQVAQAPDAVARQLADRGIGGAPSRGPDGDHHDGGSPDGLPAGTYGERRSASGHVLGHGTLVSYDQATAGHPKLPKTLTVGKIVTVSGSGPGTARYRAEAAKDPSGSGTIVVAVPLREVDQTLARLRDVEAVVIAAVLLALALAAWAVAHLGLRPLDRIGDTAGAIAAGDLSRRVDATDPRTEIGRLGVSLNAMLDRLQAAFAERQASEDRLRTFLADASHELRTPLSSIRGYAELFRMGATRSPTDLSRSMTRIEEEAARMGVLVEDLLTLARLDELAESPRTEVDLRALARDAVDDARASTPSRDITLHVNGPALVTGDEPQLRQLIANLVRNALVHTPADVPIEVSAATHHRDVRLAVRDHGPGLPDDIDPEALFERFWRSETGRERGRAGAGLGLAIVAGIVDSHGGTVAATNAEGGGASFVVHLPCAQPDLRRPGASDRPPVAVQDRAGDA